MFLGKIADVYAQNGHEVVVFEPDMVGPDPVLNVSSSRHARVFRRPKDFEQPHPFAEIQANTWTMETDDSLKAFQAMIACSKAFALSCESVLNDEKLLTDLRAEKFDIAVAEYLTVCPYALYRKLGIKKYITASATPVGSQIGAYLGLPTSFSYVPEFFRVPPIKMSFWDRLENLFGAKLAEFFFFRFFIADVLRVVERHYPDFHYESALAESSYLFINSNEFLDYPKPTSQKVINLAGLGLAQPKPLDEDYRRLLDSALGGVVLVSFGTIAQSANMPPEILSAFLQTFAAFPHLTFVWKFENTTNDVAANLTNVHLRSWLPQLDLLADPRVVGFITHGGINSVTESIVHGTPLLRNCKMLEERKLGVPLSKPQLSTADALIAALKTIVEDKTYLARAREMSEMFATAPMTPEEKVLKYTAQATRFDVASLLDLHGRHQTFIEFYNLDILGSLLLLSMVLFCASFMILRLSARFLLRLCAGSGSKTKAE
ncbi:UDP-glucuronosyltransferase [Aphelenchoides fujianensis]|nr:UDP-glucuronosyltransferase [Aphelenchoides fujianensis]